MGGGGVGRWGQAAPGWARPAQPVGTFPVPTGGTSLERQFDRRKLAAVQHPGGARLLFVVFMCSFMRLFNRS